MIKDIVVHLTGSQKDQVSLGFAEATSERFKGLDSLCHRLDPRQCLHPGALYSVPNP